MTLVLSNPSDEAARILNLARSDRKAASDLLKTRSLPDQVALLCETPVGRRSTLLDLMPAPEAVIPQVPEAELCFTIKAMDPTQVGWILEHATHEQLVACIDLDAWTLSRFDGANFRKWWLAACDAGPEVLVRWFRAMDPEVMLLELAERVVVAVGPSDPTEREDWSPPPGSQTVEGVFHFAAKNPGDDLTELTILLRSLFEASYWDYFRLMQGVIHELPTETEEWALRWRQGRLEDLGFPPRDEAVRMFAAPPVETLETLPEEAPVLEVEGWALPVWFPKVPVAADSTHAVLAAAARLGGDERQAFLYRLLAVANKVAVAYDYTLSDVDSVPSALDEAVRMTSRGIEELSARHAVPGEDLLRRVDLERLFAVGAAFFPDKAKLVLSKLVDEEEPEDDGILDV